MIDDDKYCIDILNQIKAVRSAITSVEGKILKKHMKECVKDALKSEKEFDVKVEEIIKTLKR
jgi:DNA-binding FrmR family transcriptional regulator